MAAVLALGATNPGERPILTALFAFIVAFCSASQDTVIDAFRIEILEERQQGAGAAAVVFGYRLGMLVSGAGALYLATYASWLATYAVMASLVTVGMAAILLTPEPLSYSASGPTGEDNASDGAAAWLRAYVLAPFTDFMRRPEWVIILLFILLYKFGDALAGVMANPFYVQLGFSKIEIADVSKIFGIGATIAGGLLGGVLVYRFGILRSLLACGILQMLSNLMFALQAIVGHDVAMLMLTVGIENMSGGMATAAFVAYVSALCNAAHTATQYALLSSLAALGRTVLSSSGGWLAEWLDWVDFFLLSTAAALPGLLLLIWLIRLQVVKSDTASAAGSASEVAREIRPRKLRKDG